MSTKNKQLIKNLNSGKNLDKDLPAYISMLAEQYKNQALIRSAMQYYVMYEQYAEGIFVEKEIKETVDFINEMVKMIFSENTELESEDCITRIEEERTKVIRKMEVLTNYTDQLMVYEYVLNRLEHKYDVTDYDEDDTVFTQQMMQYIFGVKDNFVINEKIKDVISQLPVRMARSKFFELLKNSISLYKGGQKESLNSYLYMIRTSAMLYHAEGEETYFADWGAFANRLKEVDFDDLDQNEFAKLLEELKEKAEIIRYTSEMFVALQELINSLYVYVLMGKDINTEEEPEYLETQSICNDIISSIEQQFAQGKKDELPAELEEKLCQLEGTPEKIAMEIHQLEGCLGLVKESYESNLKALTLFTMFNKLEKAETLLSASLFVEFGEEDLEEVTEQMADEETGKLVEEYRMLFQNSSIKVVRAVIASTIARMPVFFANTDEVSEYILTSLEQCKDKAEKQASLELLTSMMEEDK